MAKKRSASSGRSTRRVLNCLPSSEPQRDWTLAHAASAGLLEAAAAIPATKDLRENWWEIGDQGQTGSCVGWASADGLLRWLLVKAGKLAASEQVSVRYMWMAAKETDEWTDRPTTFIESAGTSLKAALDIARKLGVVRDAVLPFGSQSLYPDKMEVFYALASQLKIASYYSVGGVAGWRAWLAARGPMVARLDVDAAWNNAASTGGNLDAYVRPSEPAGHAVTIVGYTRDRFIIRNSWGSGWGDRGFAYASDAYASAAFTEAYGAIV